MFARTCERWTEERVGKQNQTGQSQRPTTKPTGAIRIAARTQERSGGGPASPQAEERQYDTNYDDKSDQVDDTVHGVVSLLRESNRQTLLLVPGSSVAVRPSVRPHGAQKRSYEKSEAASVGGR